MGTIKETVDKWDKLGFLDNSNDKIQLSLLLEKLFILTITEEFTIDENIKALIFTILRKLYLERNMLFNRFELNILIKKVNIEYKKINFSNYYNYLEGECEFINDFSKMYKK